MYVNVISTGRRSLGLPVFLIEIAVSGFAYSVNDFGFEQNVEEGGGAALRNFGGFAQIL